MRRAVSTVLICLVAFSWAAAGFGARRDLPPCCKAHGCSMLQRASHGCAFSRCDTSEPRFVAAKVLGVFAVTSVDSSRDDSNKFETFGAARIAAAPAGSIDHPPRLLLAA